MYLNSFYVQKSKLMLYPLLKFKHDHLIRPKQTYLVSEIFKNEYLLKEPNIICAYERGDENYYEYRNKIIFNNEYFVKHIPDLKFDYIVFDLSEYSKDYTNFIKGKYSKFSIKAKEIILNSYGKTKIGAVLVDTHINPEKYHQLYADELKVDVGYLTKTHETLSPPDFEKETLK